MTMQKNKVQMHAENSDQENKLTAKSKNVFKIARNGTLEHMNEHKL